MDLLKREIAPIIPEAWQEIDTEARRVLKLNLAGRRLVDFDGPHGWEHAAVNLGRLEMLDASPSERVDAGLRRVQPLLELRTPITLDIMELDAVGRGADDPDLDAVADAAERMARAEDSAIFNGFEPAGITGIIESSPHTVMTLPKSGVNYPNVIVRAREILSDAGVDGPYALALGPAAYNELAQAADDGHPIRRHVAQIVDGPIVRAPAIEGAVLLSVRGGDFLLTVGQDLSIGYADRDRHTVELYLTESFTFRVIEPKAAVYLRHGDAEAGH